MGEILGDCCYDQGDYRCNAEMYNAFDAGGNAKNTYHCCTDLFPCILGEGDCDHDSDCVTGLVCGSNNCDFGTSSHDCCTLEDKVCEDDSDCEGDLIFCGVENCLEGAGNCCYYRGEHRCDGDLFEKFDADGSAKNTKDCCTEDNPCAAGEGGKGLLAVVFIV